MPVTTVSFGGTVGGTNCNCGLRNLVIMCANCRSSIPSAPPLSCDGPSMARASDAARKRGFRAAPKTALRAVFVGTSMCQILKDALVGLQRSKLLSKCVKLGIISRPAVVGLALTTPQAGFGLVAAPGCAAAAKPRSLTRTCFEPGVAWSGFDARSQPTIWSGSSVG